MEYRGYRRCSRRSQWHRHTLILGVGSGWSHHTEYRLYLMNNRCSQSWKLNMAHTHWWHWRQRMAGTEYRLIWRNSCRSLVESTNILGILGCRWPYRWRHSSNRQLLMNKYCSSIWNCCIVSTNCWCCSGCTRRHRHSFLKKLCSQSRYHTEYRLPLRNTQDNQS